MTGLVKDEKGRITGAKMRDELTGEEWVTKSKCVVNATGPFTGEYKKIWKKKVNRHVYNRAYMLLT